MPLASRRGIPIGYGPIETCTMHLFWYTPNDRAETDTQRSLLRHGRGQRTRSGMVDRPAQGRSQAGRDRDQDCSTWLAAWNASGPKARKGPLGSQSQSRRNHCQGAFYRHRIGQGVTPCLHQKEPKNTDCRLGNRQTTHSQTMRRLP